MYDVIICSKYGNVRCPTLQQPHFSRLIILPSFSLCHVKAAVIIKRTARNSYWDRANVGVWGLSP